MDPLTTEPMVQAPPPPPSGGGASPAWAPAPPRPGDDHLWILAVLVAAIPLLLALFLAVVAAGFLAPLSDGAVTIAGLPPAVPFTLVLVGMAFVAGLLARYVRPILGVAVATLWLPIGLYMVIIGPAIVLIMKGLSET